MITKVRAEFGTNAAKGIVSVVVAMAVIFGIPSRLKRRCEFDEPL